MKYWLQQLYRAHANFFNRIFILNRITNKGQNNEFKLDKPMLGCSIKCNGNNNKIIFLPGGGLKKCTILISGNDNTVFVGCNSTAIRATVCIEDSNNYVEIESDCSLCGEVLLAACEGTDIKIGKGGLLSSNIELRTTDSHPIFDENAERINVAKNINIGERVWIGTGVRINKGVSIGRDCVVGNGSVVTKSYDENNVVIAGNPAKIVKRGVTWSKNR